MQRSNSESACGKAPASRYARPRAKWPIQVSSEVIGLGQHLDRLAGVATLQRDLAFDDLRVRLRLGLQFGREPVDQRPRLGDVAGLDEGARGQEADLHGLAVGQRLVGSGDRRRLAAARQFGIREGRELPGRAVRALTRHVALGAPASRMRTASEKRPSTTARSARPDAASDAPSGLSFGKRLVGVRSLRGSCPCPSWANARASAAYSSGSGSARASFFADLKIAGVVRIEREVVAEDRAVRQHVRRRSASRPRRRACRATSSCTAPADCGRPRRRLYRAISSPYSFTHCW